MLLRFKFFLNCKRLAKGKAASNLRNLDFGLKFLLVESGTMEYFAYGIRNPGL